MGSNRVARGKIKIVGFADDQTDQHTRISRGNDFTLYNGSADTHDKMQNKADAFMACLASRGLSPDNISRQECIEVLEEIGMTMEVPSAAEAV